MEPPRLPSLFKIPKHKTFQYKPRYYDAEAEERKEKLKKLREQENQAASENAESGRRLMRGSFKSEWRAMHERNSREKRSSNIRLAAIIFILLLLTYLILRY